MATFYECTDFNQILTVNFTEGVVDGPALVDFIGRCTAFIRFQVNNPSTMIYTRSINPLYRLALFSERNGTIDTNDGLFGIGEDVLGHVVGFTWRLTPNFYLGIITNDERGPNIGESIDVEFFISLVEPGVTLFSALQSIGGAHVHEDVITMPSYLPTAIGNILRDTIGSRGSISIVSDWVFGGTNLGQFTVTDFSDTICNNLRALYSSTGGTITVPNLVSFINNSLEGAFNGGNEDFIHVVGMRYSLIRDGDDLVVENMYYTDQTGRNMTLVSGSTIIDTTYQIPVSGIITAAWNGVQRPVLSNSVEYDSTVIGIFAQVFGTMFTVNEDLTVTFTPNSSIISTDLTYCGNRDEIYIVPNKVISSTSIPTTVRIASQPSVYA